MVETGLEKTTSQDVFPYGKASGGSATRQAVLFLQYNDPPIGGLILPGNQVKQCLFCYLTNWRKALFFIEKLRVCTSGRPGLTNSIRQNCLIEITIFFTWPIAPMGYNFPPIGGRFNIRSFPLSHVFKLFFRYSFNGFEGVRLATGYTYFR